MLFDSIHRQLRVGVGYTHTSLDTSQYVVVKDRCLSLDAAMHSVMESLATSQLSYSYKLSGDNIWIRALVRELTVTLIVDGYKGEKLPGVTVTSIPDQRTYQTDSRGKVDICMDGKILKLYVSHTGYQAEQIMIEKSGQYEVHLQLQTYPMGQMIVKGYAVGTRENNTGDISFEDSLALHQQPNVDIASYLTGRVAGFLVTQTSGWSGSSSEMSLRGKNSIFNGRGMLFIIDGIPFGPGDGSASNIPTGNSGGSLSPLSFISLDDIDNIVLLKDADATAIYGSRGANGVMLITTRKGLRGRHIDVDLTMGASGITFRPHLLNMRQYSAMRLEALRNDGLALNDANAPELRRWDTTRNVDWGKWLIGGVGHSLRANSSIAGGNKGYSYFLGAHFLRESNVSPTHPVHQLEGVHGRISDTLAHRHLCLDVSGLMSWDNNQQFTSDLTRLQFLVPNAPPLFDSSGKPSFKSNNVPFTSPLYFIGDTYQAHAHTIQASAAFSYRLFDSALAIRLNTGLSDVHVGEFSINPIWNQDWTTDIRGSSYGAGTHYLSWILEPTLDYGFRQKDWSVNLLAGVSRQGLRSSMKTFSATGFTSDAALHNIGMATDVSRDSSKTDYLYSAAFGRVNINLKNKYMLNLTDRWDGSSRFDNGRRFGNFWAAGMAWIFSREAFIGKALPFLSFGKLRASYGVTGNDQIGEWHAYLETWAPTSAISYQNTPGTFSSGTMNADISWETLRKMEAAIELGLGRRCFLTASWYRHRTGNQLLPDNLPITGAPMTLRNQPVVLQNSGWEFSISSKNIDMKDLKWTTSLNISMPVNRLLSFKGLANSPFASSLIVGRSIDVLQAYQSNGVNKSTGTFQFSDLNGDGSFTDADRAVVGKLDVSVFGGIENTVRWKHWRLEGLLEGRVQKGAQYQTAIYAANPPGSTKGGFYSNQVSDIADRWRHPGDIAPYQMVSTRRNSDAAKALNRWGSSNAIITDASFMRLRSLSLAYMCPDPLARKACLQGISIYLQAQNLFTWTPYRDGDPEIQSAVVLPPMRTVSIGVRVKI